MTLQVKRGTSTLYRDSDQACTAHEMHDLLKKALHARIRKWEDTRQHLNLLHVSAFYLNTQQVVHENQA